jgi:hypothetical protein
MNAHNVWYLVTLGRGSFAARAADPLLDTQPLLGPLNGWQIGVGLFLVWTVFVCWRVGWFYFLRGGRQAACAPNGLMFWGAAAMVVGFYMLPAEGHERYLFPALALLVPLLPGRRPFQIVYGLFSVTFFFNLVWVDSAVTLPAFSENLGWGVVISAVNVVLFLYLYWLGAKARLGFGVSS